MVTYSTITLVFVFIECHPVQYIFDKSLDGHCLKPTFNIALTYTQTGTFLSPNPHSQTQRALMGDRFRHSLQYCHGFRSPGPGSSYDVESKNAS